MAGASMKVEVIGARKVRRRLAEFGIDDVADVAVAGVPAVVVFGQHGLAAGWERPPETPRSADVIDDPRRRGVRVFRRRERNVARLTARRDRFVPNRNSVAADPAGAFQPSGTPPGPRDRDVRNF